MVRPFVSKCLVVSILPDSRNLTLRRVAKSVQINHKTKSCSKQNALSLGRVIWQPLLYCISKSLADLGEGSLSDLNIWQHVGGISILDADLYLNNEPNLQTAFAVLINAHEFIQITT